jgi:hypothetical protein
MEWGKIDRTRRGKRDNLEVLKNGIFVKIWILDATSAMSC